MQTEEYAALGGLITIIAAALALIIKQLEQSRCTRIKCCGIDCTRVPPPPEAEEDGGAAEELP
jgi:hypothetical protein